MFNDTKPFIRFRFFQVERREKAHHVCPYSNATRGNIEVKLVVTDD